MDSRKEVGPIDYVLWNVLDSVLEEEVVSVAVHALVIALDESDGIAVVAEGRLAFG